MASSTIIVKTATISLKHFAAIGFYLHVQFAESTNRHVSTLRLVSNQALSLVGEVLQLSINHGSDGSQDLASKIAERGKGHGKMQTIAMTRRKDEPEMKTQSVLKPTSWLHLRKTMVIQTLHQFPTRVAGDQDPRLIYRRMMSFPNPTSRYRLKVLLAQISILPQMSIKAGYNSRQSYILRMRRISQLRMRTTIAILLRVSESQPASQILSLTPAPYYICRLGPFNDCQSDVPVDLSKLT